MSRRNGISGRWAGILIAAAICAGAAVPAAAQNNITIDANIFWGNAGNYASDSGGASCWHGAITNTQLATSIFSNQAVDPLLVDPFNLGVPDFTPGNGSPALPNNPGHRVVKVWEADPWFDVACFNGAADFGDRWWEGWTYFNYAGGAGRTDIPATTPIDVFNVPSNTTWTTGSVYRVNGRVAVQPGATLTIQPGVVVLGAAAGAYLAVERDADLVINGTAAQPVIFTSSAAPGQQAPGDWGGIVIHGRAVANCASADGCGLTSLEGDCTSEGGAGSFGGNNDADDSGSLRYARSEYAGFEIAPNNELNAWTFNAVGSGTEVEYLQAHLGLDDMFETFGGTVRMKHLVATGGDDDNLDWQMGWRGKVQFMVVQQAGTGLEDSGIEADNNEFDANCPGISNPTVANVTMIGGPNSDFGIRFRRGTAGTVVNSIFQGWKNRGLRVEASSLARCAAQTRIADADCNDLRLGVPGEGGLRNPGIIAAAAPNPTRGPAHISFSLEKAGRVLVQVFDTGGRLVETLVDGPMAAGPQSFPWAGADASGLYFYRVVTEQGGATGKLVVTR